MSNDPILCECTSCKSNDKNGKCIWDWTDMQLNGLGRCKQIKVDMDYLRDKWKYVKGREQVVGNRPAYSPDMVEDVK